MLIGAVVGGWLLLRPDDGGRPPGAFEREDRLPTLKRKPTPSVAPVKLRAITGDQLCAAVPDAFRKSLVTDGRYGGKDASTGAATESEKRAACSWSDNKMDVGGGVLGHRSLSISVEARSGERENAVERAKRRFADDKKAHERRVNVRDGKRVDGRTSGSAFGELTQLQYGDESYSQSSIGHSGLKAAVHIRQGPWLIKVEYGGSNRSGAKYPTGDEVRAAANKVAEHVTAEMAKDAEQGEDRRAVRDPHGQERRVGVLPRGLRTVRRHQRRQDQADGLHLEHPRAGQARAGSGVHRPWRRADRPRGRLGRRRHRIGLPVRPRRQEVRPLPSPGRHRQRGDPHDLRGPRGDLRPRREGVRRGVGHHQAEGAGPQAHAGDPGQGAVRREDDRVHLQGYDDRRGASPRPRATRSRSSTRPPRARP
ncbi:hypothetical protein ACFSTC_12635 [Nonomuraea ferruginea]